MDYSDFKEKVKTANDIVDVVGKYIDLKRSGSSYKGLCPFHNEKTPSFFVMPNEQFYYCHGCHKGGDVFKFICDYNNMDFKEAVEELARSAGIDIPEKFDNTSGDHIKKGLKNQLYDIYKKSAQFYYSKLHEEGGKRAFNYLINRKISKNMITAFGLGYAPRGGDELYKFLKEEGADEEVLKESMLFSYKSGKPRDIFRDRVIFPILDRSSRVIAFGGRIMGDGQPKYLNSAETPIFSKKKTLYGLHRASKTRNNRIFLVEGYMDVVASHQAGFAEAVASLGTALTSEQAELIARLVKKVYLIYDADSAGKNAMLRAIPMLRAAGLFVNVVSIKPYKDPDELIKAEGSEGFEERINSAENAFYFETECLAEDFNRSDPSENAAFAAEVASRLAKISSKFEREGLIAAIATRFDIEKDLLEAEVNRLGGDLQRQGIIKDTEPMQKEYRQRKVKGPLICKEEKNILVALMKNKAYFPKVREYITANDFSEGLMKDLAAFVFEGLAKEASGQVFKVADIMNHYEGDDQNEVSHIFYDKFYDEMENIDREKFLADSIKTMLLKSNETEFNACMDPARITELARRKQELMAMNIQLN